MNEDYFQAPLYFQVDPPFEVERFVWEAYLDSNSASASRYYHVRTLLWELSSDPRLFRFSN